MNYKLIGGILVIVCCGGFGLGICTASKQEEWLMRQLASSLDFMLCELQYRLTPLPELCRQAGHHGKGVIGQIFQAFGAELECCLNSNVDSCMDRILRSNEGLPQRVRENLELLGASLGRFDIDGQVEGLERVRTQCRQDIAELTADKQQRFRSYQTLGLCAGAALVILFI